MEILNIFTRKDHFEWYADMRWTELNQREASTDSILTYWRIMMPAFIFYGTN